ncbi:LysR family transcriptional regulator [Hominifimenecus sp. rT4P-3]|uniref:LysR family transcriptional regulator n=1 Tax=Hominifimenecus sp. rT4P-3 TaxID=3242979 RepID=UPI003DA5531B
MNLQQLYYFRAIAQNQNYSRAAEQLLVSQSSLSHAMAELEQDLKVPLFYKIGRNIRLTEYGRCFLTYVERAINELENGRSALELMANPEQGTVRLTFVNSLSNHFIPDLIRKYYQNPSHSAVHFSLSEHRTYEGIHLLLQKECDLGFGTKTDHPDLNYYPVYQERLVAAVSSNHPWANRSHISLKELDGQDFIAYNPKCGTRLSIDQLFQKGCVHPNIVLEAPITDSMVASFTENSTAVSILPRTYGMDKFDIHMMELDDIDSTVRTVYMYWYQKTPLLPAACKFRDFVMETIPSLG